MRVVFWIAARSLVLIRLAAHSLLAKTAVRPIDNTTVIYEITDLGSFNEEVPPKDREHEPRVVDTLPTNITAMNNRGQVVGTSLTNEGYRAFTWRDGVWIDLNHLIPPNSDWRLEKALAINDAEQILGQGKLNGKFHHFLLTPAARVIRV